MNALERADDSWHGPNRNMLGQKEPTMADDELEHQRRQGSGGSDGFAACSTASGTSGRIPVCVSTGPNIHIELRPRAV